jgi:hypothetical protein
MADLPYVPLMRTRALEAILKDELHCQKLSCTDKICAWLTPTRRGFTAPNPATIPAVPLRTIEDLRKIIIQLDASPPRRID